MTVELKLREALLTVLGVASIEEIPENAALVKDLGADSLDFVEIIYIVERDFGIVLKANELVLSGAAIPAEKLFSEGRLTEEGATALKSRMPGEIERFKTGMTKAELFESITVKDLANIIRERMQVKEHQC